MAGMGVRVVGQELYGGELRIGGAGAQLCQHRRGADLGATTNNVQFWSDNGKPMMTSSPIIPSCCKSREVAHTSRWPCSDTGSIWRKRGEAVARI